MKALRFRFVDHGVEAVDVPAPPGIESIYQLPATKVVVVKAKEPGPAAQEFADALARVLDLDHQGAVVVVGPHHDLAECRMEVELGFGDVLSLDAMARMLHEAWRQIRLRAGQPDHPFETPPPVPDPNGYGLSRGDVCMRCGHGSRRHFGWEAAAPWERLDETTRSAVREAVQTFFNGISAILRPTKGDRSECSTPSS